MIPVLAHIPQPDSWQKLWRDAIRDPNELLSLLGLESLAASLSADAMAQFPMRVPRGFAAKMRHSDANDPLLRQVLPIIEENQQVAGFAWDAVGDHSAQTGGGVLQKYQGRALLITTASCAINCRYCFRRHFPYQDSTASKAQWSEAIAQLRVDTSISEVLLSGGDPLSLSTAKLRLLTDEISQIPHIRRLRLHTRLPVVLPERVDQELLDWLSGIPGQLVIVIHANHPRELGQDVAAACAKLKATGATLLNQSVLLQGVNNDSDTLVALSERLFECGVLPYYLHQLDRVHGTAHFEVPDQEAIRIHQEARARLPGYLLPQLVREIAGAASKLPLDETIN